MASPVRRVLALALMAYAAALVVVLLNPSPAIGSGLVSRVESLGVWLNAPAPFLVGARIEFGLNVVAFVPLTLLGSLLRPTVSVGTWIAAGFFGSLIAEIVQTVQPHRSATHADVVANTLGAALGAVVAWIAMRLARQ